MYIKNFNHPALIIDELTMAPGESWCLYGKNRSGVEALVDLFSGHLTAFSTDALILPEGCGVLSFRLQQELFEDELRHDDSDYLDHLDPGTPVREFLTLPEQQTGLLHSFAMDHALDLGYRQLSSGQSRKLLLLQELTRGATGLILQNPYDGLDTASCRELNRVLKDLSQKTLFLLVVVNDPEDIPDWCSHLAVCSDGRLAMAGPRQRVADKLAGLEHRQPTKSPPAALLDPEKRQAEGDQELVSLTEGYAAYSDRTIFSGVNLHIHCGEHTLITGRNGCGKSTLLEMLTGDNHNCYRNRLKIFGRQRGSGESIWEVKQQMGIVSPALHREYRVAGSALAAVLSGLHDTIGLYRRPSPSAVRSAATWLEWLGLADLAKVPFRRLAFAEQRLVLIARALIKAPKLLILDEPSQGLDRANRLALLDLLDNIARERLATIIFVSHRLDEHRPLFRQHLHLDDYCTAAPSTTEVFHDQ
jgi:molybdate transport system ATP-binding protein